MSSSFNPATIWADGFPVDKAKIRDTSTGLGKLRAEVNAGGFVTSPVTATETTGSAALAAVHTAAVKHDEYRNAINMPDANGTYNEATHGFFPQFRFPILTAQRTMTFPASQGRVGTFAAILNRATSFNLTVLREDPDNPGVYSETTVQPGYIQFLRKDNDGTGHWTNWGKFQDGANSSTADLSNLNASNLTSGTVPTARLSTAVISPHITSAVVSGVGGVIASRSITAANGLVNDQETPGADRLYGTDGGGNKGWYAKPTGAGSGLPSAHASTHSAGGSDAVSITAAQVNTSGGAFVNALISEGSVRQHEGALLIPLDRVSGLDARLDIIEAAIEALKTEEYTGELSITGTGAFIIDRRAAYPYNVNRWSGYVSPGSVTANLSVDDTTITGSTVTPNSSEDTASMTGSNRLVAADQTLKLHVTATSGTSGAPVRFAFSLLKVRV